VNAGAPPQAVRTALRVRRRTAAGCGNVDSRLRRFPPNREYAVPYGQAVENAARFPPLAHRSAAVHEFHSPTKCLAMLNSLRAFVRNFNTITEQNSVQADPPKQQHTAQNFRIIFGLE
jgi:hypothetical protein